MMVFGKAYYQRLTPSYTQDRCLLNEELAVLINPQYQGLPLLKSVFSLPRSRWDGH